MPDLGILATAEIGVTLPRLVPVPRPGAELAAVTAALLDGLDLVAVATDTLSWSGQDGVQPARRLSTRARNRRAVLLSFGSWPAADLEVTSSDAGRTGLGDGHGYIAGHEAMVTVSGRVGASRPKHARVRPQGTRRQRTYT